MPQNSVWVNSTHGSVGPYCMEQKMHETKTDMTTIVCGVCGSKILPDAVYTEKIYRGTSKNT